MRPWYEAKKARNEDDARKVVVAVMRKLAVALHHIGVKGEDFQPRRLFAHRATRCSREIEDVTKDQSRVQVVEQAWRTRLEEVVSMKPMGESAIRARDFAGFVPASRGADCRPLHPRLASLCFLGKKDNIDPRLFRRLGLGRSDLDRQRPRMGRRWPKPGVADRRAGSREIHIDTFQFVTIIKSWRNFPGGVAVI